MFSKESWPAFHHQLGVSLLASARSEEAEVALLRAWTGRPDALTAKALGRLESASPKKGLQWFRLLDFSGSLKLLIWVFNLISIRKFSNFSCSRIWMEGFEKCRHFGRSKNRCEFCLLPGKL